MKYIAYSQLTVLLYIKQLLKLISDFGSFITFLHFLSVFLPSLNSHLVKHVCATNVVVFSKMLLCFDPQGHRTELMAVISQNRE